MKNMQTTIGTFRPVHIGEDGYMATAGRVNFMMPSNRKIKVEPFDLVRVRWWVDNDGVTIADSVEVLDQADIESALHQQEQAEPVAIVRRFESGFPNDDDDLIVEPTQAAVTLKPNDPLYRHPPSAVPKGYAWVPIEPTERMICDGGRAINANGGEGDIVAVESDAVQAYRAMLAAAPQPKETGE